MKRSQVTVLGVLLLVQGCGFGEECEPEAAMVTVEADGVRFRIDAYEASRWNATEQTAGTGVGMACNYRGTIPWNNVTYEDARNACLDAGKRLCTKAEWRAACGQALYPYGGAYVAGTCNDGKVETLATGAKAGCRSAVGAFDMSGNVREWVENGAEGGALMGGGYSDGAAGLTCDAASDVDIFTYTPTQADGFRCCSDVPIQ